VKRWQNLAAPDDPDSYYSVDRLWPTPRGTYESTDQLTGTDYAATGAGAVSYAWCALTTTSRKEYVVDSAKIWQWGSPGFTDRTGGVAIGSYPFMTQYGDITICAMGNSTATVKATTATGNFSALAGAPKAEIFVVQSNAVIAFNTDTSPDGWAASDVGDYTNWTTGEAASGRIIHTPGPITAAVPWGNDVIAFKANAIYRMIYVGGVVKWQIQLIYNGIGCQALASGVTQNAKYFVVAGTRGIFFSGNYDPAAGSPAGTKATSYIYLFDGASAPIRVNPLTQIPEGKMTYDPTYARLFVQNANGTGAQYFCHESGAWGIDTASTTGTAPVPLLGDLSAHVDAAYLPYPSSLPTMYEKVNANNITRYEHTTQPAPVAARGTPFVQTSRIGKMDQKTKFSRVTPILRRRTALSGGANTASCTADFYRERDDSSTVVSKTVAEATNRHRFDVTQEENYGQFKVTWTGADVEIDDVLVVTAPGAKE